MLRLQAVGQGHYDRVFQNAGGLSIPIRVDRHHDDAHVVTVEGIWTGDAIDHVRIVSPVAPVAPPEHLGARIDPAIVPRERRSREELLTPPVLEAVDRLRAEGLLFYGVHRLVDGWVGVACTTNAESAVDALEPLLGAAFTVVEVTWSGQDLERADDALDLAARDGVLLFQGKFMDPGGHYRTCALVGMVTQELYGALSAIDSDALVLDSWIRRA
ncbi:hypothetical protein [Microbacterium rhizomatis]|uniref:Uncharacterized protein n=1 Tax=Microbacterium rhizomatis TaxID=1631477 RepID=A0A5J5J0W3_9MICO|nr:hypothetical protein [Microbacterium rhizomatis]KAA9107624.1 hypothetical protein F6B43_09165 [Microbacterium rhizomatis]